MTIEVLVAHMSHTSEKCVLLEELDAEGNFVVNSTIIVPEGKCAKILLYSGKSYKISEFVSG